MHLQKDSQTPKQFTSFTSSKSGQIVHQSGDTASVSELVSENTETKDVVHLPVKRFTRLFLRTLFIIFPSTPRSPKWSFSFQVFQPKFCTYYLFPIHATYRAHLILGLMSLLLLVTRCKVMRSLWHFVHTELHDSLSAPVLWTFIF
jgi:hypothetical protein